MNKNHPTTKETRMEFRIETELKQDVNNYCHEHNYTASEFIREAIIKKLNTDSNNNPTQQLLLANKIYNLTLAFPNLDPKYKKLLQEELLKHE